MSRHEESFHIPIPPERAKHLCADAITSLGWPISNDLGYGLVSVESFQFGLNWPATVKVVLDHGDGRMSLIKIEASNFGFGPIQSSHVRGKAIALRERIEQLSHGPIPKLKRNLSRELKQQQRTLPARFLLMASYSARTKLIFLRRNMAVHSLKETTGTIACVERGA